MCVYAELTLHYVSMNRFPRIFIHPSTKKSQRWRNISFNCYFYFIRYSKNENIIFAVFLFHGWIVYIMKGNLLLLLINPWMRCRSSIFKYFFLSFSIEAMNKNSNSSAKHFLICFACWIEQNWMEKEITNKWSENVTFYTIWQIFIEHWRSFCLSYLVKALIKQFLMRMFLICF